MKCSGDRTPGRQPKYHSFPQNFGKDVDERVVEPSWEEGGSDVLKSNSEFKHRPCLTEDIDGALAGLKDDPPPKKSCSS